MLLGKVIEEDDKQPSHLVPGKKRPSTAHQCGYRRHHTTTDQLLYLENGIQNNFIEDKHNVVVFFDFEKVFDKT